MKPIMSVRDFASRIGIPAEQLYAVAADIKSHYRYWAKWNAERTKSRNMRVPDDDLMEIQRRIHTRILIPFGVSEIAYGGVRGKSPGKNAAVHLGQAWVVTLDAKDFFGNVHYKVVYKTLRHHLGCGRDVASLITRLTTLDDELPQGSPTSTTLSNLVMADPVDAPLSRDAHHHNIRLSRFVDDVCLSGSSPQSLINRTAELLSHAGLSMYRKKAKFQVRPKLKITPRSRPQEVTGLLVNSLSGPTISRQKRDAAKAAIFQLRSITDSTERATALNSINGRIAYVAQFNPGAAKRLRRYAQAALYEAVQKSG